jgi:uncharacterized protein YecE (DUF72 family)
MILLSKKDKTKRERQKKIYIVKVDVIKGEEDMATQILDTMGIGQEEIRERMERSKMNAEWLQSHIKELKEKYGDEFVAVDNKKVIKANQDLNTLVSSLRKKYEHVDVIAIEFISKEDYLLVI